MQFEIQAGARIEVVTPAEMRTELAGWLAEIRRGVKFRRAGGQARVAAGVWRLDTSTKTGDLGPAPGFLWSVTNIAVQGGGYVLGTDTFNVYVNDPGGLTVIATGVTRQLPFDVGGLVLTGGDFLTLTGVGTGVAGTDVGVTLLVAEVPEQLAWQLL